MRSDQSPPPPATPICDAMRAAGQWNRNWEPMAQLDAQWTEKFMSMVSAPLNSGVIDPKTFELLAIAVDASVTHMYGPGVRRHIRRARDQMNLAGDLPQRPLHLRMTGMADEHQRPPLRDVAPPLAVHLGDQRAGRIQHRQSPRSPQHPRVVRQTGGPEHQQVRAYRAPCPEEQHQHARRRAERAHRLVPRGEHRQRAGELRRVVTAGKSSEERQREPARVEFFTETFVSQQGT